MKSRVYLVEHLSADELYRLYREEKDPTRRTHLQALWLVTSGRPAKVAAEVTGYTQRWLSVLIGRYNAAGVEGLGDLRRFNPGSRPLVAGEKLERLDRALEDPPPDGGLWTRRLVAQGICGLINRLVSPRRGRDYLRRLGFTRQVPRPRHAEGDFAAQEAFKAGFRARVQERRAPTRTARCKSGRSTSIAPGSSRSSAGSGHAGASVRGRSDTIASLGSMSMASSARPPGRWCGSWTYRRTRRCSARSWRPSPARSEPARTLLSSLSWMAPAGMSPRIWSSRTASTWSSCLPTHPNCSR